MGKQRRAKAVRRALSAVDREMKKDGVFARIEAVQAAMFQPDFAPRFRAAITGAEADIEIQGIPKLGDVLYRFLQTEMKLDTRDVQIFIDWQPDLGRKMTFSYAPTVAAVQRAKDILCGRLAVA